MEIKNIISFLKVAELSSFTKAAEQLGYTQAAVTIQLRQLEDELGTHLFDRIGKNVSLTSDGIAFIEHAYRIIKEVDDAKKLYQPDMMQSGTITIGTMESLNAVFIPDAIKVFHEMFPNVNIKIKTSTAKKLVDMAMSNEVDMVFFLDDELYGKRCGYSFEFQHNALFVASPRHPLSNKQHVSVDELIGQEFILTEEDINYRKLMEICLLRIKGRVLIEPYLEMENTSIIKRMVIDGKGLSLLPDFIVIDKIKSGELSVLNVDDIQIKMWSQLIYHRSKWLTLPMRGFIRILEDTIKNFLSKNFC